MKQVAYKFRFVVQYPEDRERPWPDHVLARLPKGIIVPEKIGQGRPFAIIGVEYIGEDMGDLSEGR